MVRQAKYPEDYEARNDDKFNYRYRGGESYRDVVVRLEPVIMELERQENILIIGHQASAANILLIPSADPFQAILRCLYSYFLGLTQEELPYIKVSWGERRRDLKLITIPDPTPHNHQNHADGIWLP